MRLALATVLSLLPFVASAAPVSMDDQLPVVSRERLAIQTVRRGDLVSRLEANGTIRRTDTALETVFNIGADGARDLMVGQPAMVGIGSRLHQGQVVRISAGPGSEFAVAVTLRGAPGGIAGDEPVAASIQTGELNDVLLVGGVRSALPGSSVSWFRIDAGTNHATRVRVRLGKTTARQAEIWEGLSEGDRVITSGVELPESVQRIRLR